MPNIKSLIFLMVLLLANTSFAQTLGIPSADTSAAIKSTKPDAVNNADAEADTDEDTSASNVKYVPAKEKQAEEEDDNSAGSVVKFKFVEGKVVFEEDYEREILVYYRNYSVNKGMDGMTRCSLRIYVLNDLTERINNLSIKVIWPEISTALQYSHMKPGVSRYNDITLLGDGCFTMDKTPTIEVNRCRVKGLSEEQCADKVKWFQTKH